MKVIRWIKRNWYYLLIVPAIIVAIVYLFKISAAVLSGSDDIAGNPDTTETDRQIQDIHNNVDREFDKKEKDIKKEHEENLNELSSGDKKPSDIFNEEIFGKDD